jgi:hypothetical protein
LCQRLTAGAQPGEHVLHHILGGGTVTDQEQRQPDQVRVVLPVNQGDIGPLARRSGPPTRLGAAGPAPASGVAPSAPDSVLSTYLVRTTVGSVA